MRIKEIADQATVAARMRRDDESALLLQTVWASADPDSRFLECVRPLFRGPECTQIYRRAKTTELATLVGVSKQTMKQYLLEAGIINQSV